MQISKKELERKLGSGALTVSGSEVKGEVFFVFYFILFYFGLKKYFVSSGTVL